MNISRYKPQLASLFDVNNVILAYLSGSQAKGTTNRESDIGIAVLLSDQISRLEYERHLAKLSTELISIFQQDAVDVTLLNAAPPLLVFQVVRHGIVIYNPHQQRVPFYIDTFNRYVDTQSLRDL